MLVSFHSFFDAEKGAWSWNTKHSSKDTWNLCTLSLRVNERRGARGRRLFVRGGLWWVERASSVGGGSGPQSSGLQGGKSRLLSPRSVGSHAVSQDCVRELSDAFQGDASDAPQMPHNLQKQTDFVLLNHPNMF